MRVLITGATGYIGRRVVASLTSLEGIEILSLVRNVEKARKLLPFSNCKHVAVDDMKSEVLKFQPQMVLHLATLSTSRNDEDIIEPIIEANILFGVKLLNVISLLKSVKLFVNVGSFAEYRGGVELGIDDAYLYTATKSAFRCFLDYYSHLCGFKYIIAVPFTVYGGDDIAKKLIDYMVDSIGAEESVKMSPGEQVLDFVHVDDVVNFFIESVKHFSSVDTMPKESTYYLGTGVGTRVRDLAQMLTERLRKELNIQWGGLSYRPLDVMYAVAPISMNSTEIPWRAQISLTQGIEKHIESKQLNNK